MKRGVWTALLAGLLVGATTAVAIGASGGVTAYKVAPFPHRERMTLTEARRTVALLDQAYQSTLRHVHRRFPVGHGQPVVAALVMRDVQREVSVGGGLTSRFMAARGKAMNADHEPRDDFERQAARELGQGARWVESIEGGRLRVATPVSLGGGCFPCHSTPSGGFALAAISWSVPVETPAGE